MKPFSSRPILRVSILVSYTVFLKLWLICYFRRNEANFTYLGIGPYVVARLGAIGAPLMIRRRGMKRSTCDGSIYQIWCLEEPYYIYIYIVRFF